MKNLTVSNEILQAYLDYINQHLIAPSLSELVAFAKEEKYVGVTRKTVETRIGGMKKLLDKAKFASPLTFKKIWNEEDFYPNAKKKAKLLNEYSRFVIISAVCGGEVAEDHLNSIISYAKKRDAAVLLMPIKKGRQDYLNLSPKLKRKDLHLITDETHLNTNIKLIPLALNPSAARPHAGMSRVGRRSCSIVLPSTKLFKETVATANDKMPHQIITTGVITLANYSKGLIISKNEYIAENDHKLSAIIVEVASPQTFFQREIEFDTDGSFVDIGLSGCVRYSPDGKTKSEVAEGFSVGDSHFPFEVDPVADSIFRYINKNVLKANHTFLHDIYSFSGRSHHEKDNEIAIIKKSLSGHLDLRDELKQTAKHLNNWSKASKNVHIVPSNHIEHLDKYLASGEHRKDPHNAKIVLNMILKAIDNQIPLRVGLEDYTNIIKRNMHWHRRDASFKILGCEMLFHGDRGGDGARGSITNLQLNLGSCIIGHSHKPGIYGDVFQNGTSTYIDVKNRPGYTAGSPSSWLQTSTAVFKGKKYPLRTQLTIIDGSFCLDHYLWLAKNKKNKKAA